ncbi:hypothetical protein JOQ06_007643, partial [Pogonophryne albipinna]
RSASVHDVHTNEGLGYTPLLRGLLLVHKLTEEEKNQHNEPKLPLCLTPLPSSRRQLPLCRQINCSLVASGKAPADSFVKVSRRGVERGIVGLSPPIGRCTDSGEERVELPWVAHQTSCCCSLFTNRPSEGHTKTGSMTASHKAVYSKRLVFVHNLTIKQGFREGRK